MSLKNIEPLAGLIVIVTEFTVMEPGTFTQFVPTKLVWLCKRQPVWSEGQASVN
jgi:hypothetical protein